MEVTFRTYCGEAGDLQELLIGKTDSGYEYSLLIPRTGWFKLYRIRRAKKKILNQLEIITGRTPTEK